MKTRAIIIAGTHSGSGKTTVTLSLMAAFRARGYRVQGFKVGPDYIDPSLHKVVTGKASVNLDSWMIPTHFLKNTFARHASLADISIIEGVMGLYDSKTPTTDDGSTAELAKILDLPVVLVVDASAMARSAAALVKGFVEFDPEVKVAGVIFNNVGSPKHYQILEEALCKYTSVPVLGGYTKNTNIEFPSRHLGLFMGEDGLISSSFVKTLADLGTQQLDLDSIENLAATSIPDPDSLKIEPILHSPKKMGIASDRAFCFYYVDNLEILEKLGFELVFFSPIHDNKIPDGVHAIYIGGGYPELYAKALSENNQMRESIRNFSQQNGWIYAECGGLMYLGKEIADLEENQFPMCNIFSFATRMLPKLKSLGYVEITPAEDFLFLKKGQTVRGHEFHYSEIIDIPESLSSIYISRPKGKTAGFRLKNTLASYTHLHFSMLVRTC